MSGQSRRKDRVDGEKWTLHDLRGRSVQSANKIRGDCGDELHLCFPRGIKLIVRPGKEGYLMMSVSHEKMIKQEVEFPVEK